MGSLHENDEGAFLLSCLCVPIRVLLEAVLAAASSLFMNDSPISWLISLFLTPALVLFPLSLFWQPAERMLGKFSPEVKKCYNLMLFALFVFIILVQAAHQFLSSSDETSSWQQWVNPLCALRMRGGYTTPAEAFTESIANASRAAMNAVTNPSNGTRVLYLQLHESLLLIEASPSNTSAWFSNTTTASVNASRPIQADQSMVSGLFF